jgi:hypothetical protein
MTKHKKLQFIREKCIESNPEIVELKFGCEGMWHFPASENTKGGVIKAVILEKMKIGAIHIFTEENKKRSNLTWRTATILPSDFREIIGRTIRLADVLFTIKHKEIKQEKEMQRKVNELGGSPGIKYPLFYQAMMTITKYELDKGGFWNLLKDDLTLQSEETIDFIYNLLS